LKEALRLAPPVLASAAFDQPFTIEKGASGVGICVCSSKKAFK